MRGDTEETEGRNYGAFPDLVYNTIALFRPSRKTLMHMVHIAQFFCSCFLYYFFFFQKNKQKTEEDRYELQLYSTAKYCTNNVYAWSSQQSRN